MDGGHEEMAAAADAAADPPDLSKTYTPPGQDAAALDPGGSWSPPSQFEDFVIERELGRGAMGVVFLARQISLDRPVALKFIASQRPGPLVRTFFETEALNVARLQHPNVVSVFSIGKVSGHPYIVSEYVPGGSLKELPLPLPWRRALTLGLGLARGLAAAHRQGILHRDVKPSNVLVTEGDQVKLLDFGLAERFDPHAPSSSAGARPIVGTPRYMAPELFRGEQSTPQGDVYALGMVLYELCTGEVPHHTPSLSSAVPGIDPDFAKLVERCLSSDPAKRFVDAEELSKALEQLERLHSSAPLDAGNPYRGLAPFEAEHYGLFFGRDNDIRKVIERLSRQPMVLVAGDSGVGKSSLCRAGVLPRVEAGTLEPRRSYKTMTLWPGRRPLETLAAALAPLLNRKEVELVTALRDTPSRVAELLREAFQGDRGLLLFIDQLEELVTLSDTSQAEHFARFVGELALPAPTPGVRVLLAVRGDFLTRVTALPGLGDEAERALFLLRPMSPAGIRKAIVGPARSRGVVFESEELIQTLVASATHGAGSLPLLQFALAELWDRRDPANNRLTRAALDEMGGVAGALSRHADGVLARLSPAEHEAARRLL